MSEGKSLELLLDTRLSFRENFLLFEDYPEIKSFADRTIMAEKGKFALRKDVPLAAFNLPSFTRLYLY